ncbi:MAG: hypothetical protein GY788_20800 [bacterium]|nr:hypothetical protein [bacterium]
MAGPFDILLEDAAAWLPILLGLAAVRETIRWLSARTANAHKGLMLWATDEIESGGRRISKPAGRIAAPPLMVVTVAEQSSRWLRAIESSPPAWPTTRPVVLTLSVEIASLLLVLPVESASAAVPPLQ